MILELPKRLAELLKAHPNWLKEVMSAQDMTAPMDPKYSMKIRRKDDQSN
jgi:hypothetical protein